MAEVIKYWPAPRPQTAAQFFYPWDVWTALDDNGHGDIWLTEQGVDFPLEATAYMFRSLLYNRCNRITAKRKRDAPLKLMRVKGTDKVKKVPVFKPMHVKIRVVSDTTVAFQFYDSEVPPTPPPPPTRSIPRRQPLHARVRTSEIQRVR